MEENATRLKRILVTQSAGSLRFERINEHTPLYGKGLGLDSLEVVALVVRLEDEFDIFFAAEDLAAGVETFGRLLSTIESKLQQNTAAGDSEKVD